MYPQYQQHQERIIEETEVSLNEVDCVLLAVGSDVIAHELVAVLPEDIYAVPGAELHVGINLLVTEADHVGAVHTSATSRWGCWTVLPILVYAKWQSSTASPPPIR